MTRRSSTAEVNTCRDMLGLCGSLSLPSLLLPLDPVTRRRLCVRGAFTAATRESICVCLGGVFAVGHFRVHSGYSRLFSLLACLHAQGGKDNNSGNKSDTPLECRAHHPHKVQDTRQSKRHDTGDRGPQKRATTRRVTAEPNAHTVTTPPARAWENPANPKKKANNANRQAPWTRTSDPRPPPPDHSHEQRDMGTAPQPAHNARGAGTHHTGHAQRWALIHHDATPKCHCRHTEYTISSVQLILRTSPTDASVNDGPYNTIDVIGKCSHAAIPPDTTILP
ncbi:exo-alpha-sialidase [Trypanosoma cruzi]|nr:exo-alpha-sialidase [Trypanosoma cruzi]